MSQTNKISTEIFTLKEIGLAAERLGKQCPDCGKAYSVADVKSYPMEDQYAIRIGDRVESHWVYFHCSHCEYDAAIHKIFNGR